MEIVYYWLLAFLISIRYCLNARIAEYPRIIIPTGTMYKKAVHAMGAIGGGYCPGYDNSVYCMISHMANSLRRNPAVISPKPMTANLAILSIVRNPQRNSMDEYANQSTFPSISQNHIQKSLTGLDSMLLLSKIP